MVLKIADLRKRKVELSEFKEELQKQIPLHAYLYTTPYPIAFSALSLITDIDVRKSIKSVEEKSKEVLLEYYGEINGDQFAHLFVINILDFRDLLPIVYKQQLETSVKEDLSRIDELITHYTSLDFIKDYRKKERRPNNHRERTILEFYTRTLKKREVLIEYLLFKLSVRAVDKARERSGLRHSKKPKSKSIQWAYDEYIVSKDFPYRDQIIDLRKGRYSYSIDFEKLDYRKINLVANKYFAIGTRYDASKGLSRQFYKAINKIGIERTLQSTIEIVRTLPIVKNRYKIFVELKKLAESNLWYGFYSLALPQIEGIFSEMVKASLPTNVLTGTLSDKVQHIRPFYEHSEYSFDYYEYYLPEARNHFAHTGKVDDVKRKCKILALDLRAIVHVFGELNSPIIQVRKIIDKGADSITDIGKLSNLLNLVELSKKSDLFQEVKSDCDHFVYSVLPSSMNFKSFFKNLEIDFDQAFKKYSEQIEMFSHSIDGGPLDMDSFRGTNLESNLKILQAVHDAYLFMFDEYLKLLIDTHYVITIFRKLFPQIPIDISDLLTAFYGVFNEQMKIINVIDKRLKIKIPDDFLLIRKDLIHNIENRRL